MQTRTFRIQIRRNEVMNFRVGFEWGLGRSATMGFKHGSGEILKFNCKISVFWCTSVYFDGLKIACHFLIYDTSLHRL